MRDDATECEACDGSGTVEIDGHDWRGEHTSVSVDCATCDGEGTVAVDPDDLGDDADEVAA